jgi:FMN phosphatase YigB (HAD superfamily)
MRILLDMDEVLCDFTGGACAVWEVDPEDVRRRAEWDLLPRLNNVLVADGRRAKDAPALTREEFWAPILFRGEAFWRELPPLPWALSVWSLVRGVTDDWHVVSAPQPNPACYAGKVAWLKAWFGPDFDRFALTPHKHIFAGPDAVLVDDSSANCEAFRAAGGRAVLFPAPHNHLRTHAHCPADYLATVLKGIRDHAPGHAYAI